VINKSISPASVLTGETAMVTLTIDNNLGGEAMANCTFWDDVDASGCMTLVSASCDSNPPITIDCGGASGNQVASGADFGVPMRATQEITFEVLAGNTPGDCLNEFTVVCGAPPGFDQTDGDTVTIEAGPSFSKSVAPGNVPAGGGATFTITVNNTAGGFDLTNCQLTDNVAAGGCMNLDLGSCSGSLSGNVDCASGDTITTTAPFNVNTGGTETLMFDVTAGATTGPCLNTASLTCDGFNGNAPATLNIGGGGMCDLVGVDLSWPPLTPPRTAPWVYTTDCGGGDIRLDNAMVVHSLDSGTGGDTPDDYAGGTAGTMRMYQIDCSCADSVSVYKNLSTGKVAVQLN
jgi:hypothetical protein